MLKPPTVISDSLVKPTFTNNIKNFYPILNSGGIYILEDFKFPNYYPHLNDCSEKKIDEILICLKNKKNFASNILSGETIQYLLDFIEDIFEYKGLLEDSDIAFIKKLN